MRTEEKIVLLVAGLVCVGIVLALGVIIGEAIGTSDVCSKAIEAGVARYTVDPKTGKTTFEWVTPEGGE